MAELAAGVYEKLVTHELHGRLQAVDDDLVHREGLADEEVLVRHLAELTRRALSIVGEKDDKDPLARQVAAANRIALAIAQEVADSVTDGDLVTSEAEMLLE